MAPTGNQWLRPQTANSPPQPEQQQRQRQMQGRNYYGERPGNMSTFGAARQPQQPQMRSISGPTNNNAPSAQLQGLSGPAASASHQRAAAQPSVSDVGRFSLHATNNAPSGPAYQGAPRTSDRPQGFGAQTSGGWNPNAGAVDYMREPEPASYLDAAPPPSPVPQQPQQGPSLLSLFGGGTPDANQSSLRPIPPQENNIMGDYARPQLDQDQYQSQRRRFYGER